MALILNIITEHIPPQYHVVFYDTFYTVEHLSKVTVGENWKNLVEDHSELTTQENSTLAKYWHLNESSSMILPREAWKEY